VVVRASAREHVELAAIIEALDRARDQVMLEVTLITVRNSHGFNLGVELANANVNGEGVDTIGFTNFGIGAIDPVTGILRLAPQPAIGLNYAIFNSDDFSIVLNALETIGDTRIQSAPRVLVQDN